MLWQAIFISVACFGTVSITMRRVFSKSQLLVIEKLPASTGEAQTKLPATMAAVKMWRRGASVIQELSGPLCCRHAQSLHWPHPWPRFARDRLQDGAARVRESCWFWQAVGSGRGLGPFSLTRSGPMAAWPSFPLQLLDNPLTPIDMLHKGSLPPVTMVD